MMLFASKKPGAPAPRRLQRTRLIYSVAALVTVLVAVGSIVAWTLLTTPKPQPKPVVAENLTPNAPPPAATPQPRQPPPTANPRIATAKSPDDTLTKIPGAKPDTNVPQQVAVPNPADPGAVDTGQKVPADSLATMTADNPTAAQESEEKSDQHMVTVDNLAVLRSGMSYAQVTAIMGFEGNNLSASGHVNYEPPGWALVEWKSMDGGSVQVNFNEGGLLVSVDVKGILGSEVLVNDPTYAVRSWLNSSMAQNSMMVRVPTVQLSPSGSNDYGYQATLVNEAGLPVGAISGVYRLGNGRTTFAPNDPLPYAQMLEGLYEYTRTDGVKAANSFVLVKR